MTPPRIDQDWLTAPATQAVCGMLTDAGFHALFVGGCVRNTLLGAPVSDLDISTDARPEKVMELAEKAGLKCVPTGIDHGTVTVIAEGRPFEITTFRKDVETDGRRAVVAFADTVEEDARRRDFTMNALYCDSSGAVLDPLGGYDDLVARRVRFIGDPGERIREDFLRILRFFRFHAWYGDQSEGIDAEGLAACAEHGDGIETLSNERLGQEMLKLLSAPDPAPATAAMAACGALWRVLPGAGSHLLTVLVHIEEVASLSPDPIRRLAAVGGEDVAERLRLSRDRAGRLARLRDAMVSEIPPHELGYRLGAEDAVDALSLRAALGGREVEPDDLTAARDAAGQKLPLAAADLMPGLSGPALGDALKEAEARWIRSGFTLTRQELMPPSGQGG